MAAERTAIVAQRPVASLRRQSPSQRLDRVDPRRRARGNPAGGERDGDESYRGERERQRIPRGHAEEERAEGACGGERARQADGDAGDREQPAFADDERAHGAGLRAEREADAHLALAPAHRVAQHSVEPDSRERQRQQGVSGDDQHRETFLRDAAADDLGEHTRLVEDERGIDGVELATDVVEQRCRRTIRRHHLGQPPVAVGRELAVQVIDDGRCRRARAHRDVGDDADDLGLAARDTQRRPTGSSFG